MNYTRHFECGCKVVVIGELTNAVINYCPKHEAAPDMYEALTLALNDLSEEGNITSRVEAIMWDAFHKAKGK